VWRGRVGFGVEGLRAQDLARELLDRCRVDEEQEIDADAYNGDGEQQADPFSGRARGGASRQSDRVPVHEGIGAGENASQTLDCLHVGDEARLPTIGSVTSLSMLGKSRRVDH
jgi:hypothetical protein